MNKTGTLSQEVGGGEVEAVFKAFFPGRPSPLRTIFSKYAQSVGDKLVDVPRPDRPGGAKYQSVT